MLLPDESVIATLQFNHFPEPMSAYRGVCSSWLHCQMCDKTNKCAGCFTFLGWVFVAVGKVLVSLSIDAEKSVFSILVSAGRPMPILSCSVCTAHASLCQVRTALVLWLNWVKTRSANSAKPSRGVALVTRAINLRNQFG